MNSMKQDKSPRKYGYKVNFYTTPDDHKLYKLAAEKEGFDEYSPWVRRTLKREAHKVMERK